MLLIRSMENDVYLESMEEGGHLLEVLSKGISEEAIVALERYLRRVHEGNENPRVFHRVLPKILLHVLGSEEKKGWLESFKTEREVDALLELLSPRGGIIRSIAWVVSEDNFLYEVPISKLPAMFQKSTHQTKDYDSLSPANHLMSFSNPPLSPLKNVGSSPVKRDTSVISERFDRQKATDSTLKLDVLEYYLFYFLHFMKTSRTLTSHRIFYNWTKRGHTSRPKKRASLSPGARMSEIIETLDLTSKHFDSSKLLTPEFTADPLTLYIEILKVYLAFFVPSEKIDYTTKELEIHNLHKRDLFSPRTRRNNIPTTENPIGMSWNIFTAREFECFRGRALQITKYFMEVLVDLWIPFSHRQSPTFDSQPGWAKIFDFGPSITDRLKCLIIVISHLNTMQLSPMTPISSSEIFTVQKPRMSVFPTLRRIFNNCLRLNLYHFLFNAIVSWPHEPSFHWVVDLWLLYIQPWNTPELNELPFKYSSASEKRVYFSDEWSPYIYDNFLFFTLIMKKFLDRCVEFNYVSNFTDTSLLKKVFSTYMSNPKLVELLINGERAIETLASVDNQDDLHRLRYLGDKSEIDVLHTIKDHLMLMEGSKFSYENFFLDKVKFKVKIFAKQLQDAASDRDQLGLNYKSTPNSFGDSLLTEHADQSDQANHKKMIYDIYKMVLDLFNLAESDLIQISSTGLQLAEIRSKITPNETLHSTLSLEGKEQVKKGWRKCDNRNVPILRNEDELIICTYENAYLARWTVKWSRLLNEKYIDLINKTSRNYHLTVPESARAYRINLRFLASYPNIITAICLYMIYCLLKLAFINWLGLWRNY